MIEKLARLLVLINRNRGDIVDITPSDGEYYFKFRDKFFSIRKGRNASFFAYPKWTGDISGLMSTSNDSANANYVYISGSDSNNLLGEKVLDELYDWIDAKSSGVDTLFADLGIN
ncbi:hypothetical protein LVB87_03355 [Lysobacter sp. KIS68-7]|uniref:hypothetical protein n=1 Tax=Lysobacter sp. KIS68-7 TaxID=2904252 RepID=UPI001E300E54|nr:hypothetical protein [Lysobacter sp. KIS68-7]UHQ20213.1 hypothetical protein LVB87_03355 [Lysobacter sp. KIS68-7]